MKIDLNKNLKGLDGVEIVDSNIGKLVASLLAGSAKGDAVKLMFWAQKLYDGNVIELDPSDFATLKNFISEQENLTNLAKAQIFELLTAAENTPSEKPLDKKK